MSPVPLESILPAIFPDSFKCKSTTVLLTVFKPPMDELEYPLAYFQLPLLVLVEQEAS